MQTHLALLRGINVGGNKKVAMVDLRACVEKIGFKNPRTLLQSGNLVFQSDGNQGEEALEATLEAAVARDLGLQTVFLVRSTAEWTRVVAQNPFPEEAATMPSRLVVMFCRQPPSPAAVGALSPGIVGGERLHVAGRHLYATFPDGISNSPMSNLLMGPKFSRHATGRNWNTVTKMAALAAG